MAPSRRLSRTRNTGKLYYLVNFPRALRSGTIHLFMTYLPRFYGLAVFSRTFLPIAMLSWSHCKFIIHFCFLNLKTPTAATFITREPISRNIANEYFNSTLYVFCILRCIKRSFNRLPFMIKIYLFQHTVCVNICSNWYYSIIFFYH